MAQRFQILSLSGGGFLGLYTISVLAELEQEIGRPLATSFDLIAGTSIGGLIGLALAAEIPASKIKDAIDQAGPKIFSSRPRPQTKVGAALDVLRFLMAPKYNDGPLRSAACRIFEHIERIGELKHRVLIPTVNVTKGAPQVFKTPHHPTYRRDLNVKVVDVAIATAAAPAYFPIAAVGDELFIDGGLYANSPDLLAVHEAEHFLEQRINDVHVLSVGTTTSKFSMPHQTGRSLGIIQWAAGQRLVRIALAAQQQSVDFVLGHRLGDRYFRIDAIQSVEQRKHLGLDVATPDASKTIRGLAAGSVQDVISRSTIREMLRHTAETPVFYP